MINISELESRWVKYKLKSSIPYIIIFIAIVVIIYLVYIISENQSFTKQEVTTLPQKIVQVEVTTEKKIINKDPIYNTDASNKVQTPKESYVAAPSSKVVLSPSFDFIKKMRTGTLPYYNEEKSIQNSKVTTYKEEELFESDEDAIIEEQNSNEASSTIEITRSNSDETDKQDVYNDIDHVRKRFENNNNPTLSLFIAKKYYEVEDYSQAYNYALLTNEINSNIEDSWIIFVKSLVKLDKKEKALDTLRKYIKHSHSNRAKVLYDEITEGKMK